MFAIRRTTENFQHEFIYSIAKTPIRYQNSKGEENITSVLVKKSSF